MKSKTLRRFIWLVLAAGLGLWGCKKSDSPQGGTIVSPDGKIKVGFALSSSGRPQYWVTYKDSLVIDTSSLGLILRDSADLVDGFSLTGTEQSSRDTTWTLPWGEREKARDHYNAQTFHLHKAGKVSYELDLLFRVYDDGMAFRYHIPAQDALKEFVLADETTEFKLMGDHTCWWIPGDWDSYEHLFNQTKLSQINALAKAHHPNLVASTIPNNAVATPFTMRTANGLHLSIHEAALLDYPEMTLRVGQQPHSFVTELVGRKDSMKADLKAPFSTPWRMIQIAESAAGLAESAMILNLNEPNKVGDVSWFKPQVYMGIWWEMHIGKASWDMASGKHGATTENAKKYIDFASAHGIHGLLIEGWNTGWEHWIGFPDREGIFDFVTPYPDYDLEEVVRYGREKGVELIMHHETSAAPRTYEAHMDSAYILMEHLGIHVAKTGYVGPIIPDGEHHGGQWMVRHYQKAIETAAKHKIALDIHEPIKDTGLRRTWPNAIAREGMRGQEFNAWSTDGGNPASHHTIIPFTCGLAGPLDYTPGIFNIKLKPWKPNNQVNTTLAHQLALYVVIYSPVQMAADLPENYAGQPGFQFIQEVGTDWSETRVLDAVIGEYAVYARKQRGTENWFIGAVTGENGRQIKRNFDFLNEGTQYKCTIYADGPKAHWNDNPTDLKIESRIVTRKDFLQLDMAPGGGAAVSLFPVEK